VTTAFQPDAFQSDAFQIAGGVAATTFEVTFTVIEGDDTVSLNVGLPRRDTGAGRSKRRKERYIARYQGEYHEFGTLEDLEAFVAQAKEQESNKPKKQRSPIKITLTPEFQEEISPVVDIPPRIESMPTGAALAQIRKIDFSLERFLAEAQRKADEEEEELLMLLL
jgi:hypothetical protein